MAKMAEMDRGGSVKDVIVCCYLTHRNGMMDEYDQQLRQAEIDTCFHIVTLPDGINSVTARWKLEYMQEMCDRLQAYSRIVFTDAWDVLFFGTREDLLTKLPACPVVSAERNCWPEPEIAEHLISQTPWRFSNPGLISGGPSELLEWIDDALKTPSLDLMEQAWMNRRLAARDLPFALDGLTYAFYTVSADQEDGALQIKDDQIWNSRFDTYPQFFHFSGKCPSRAFRDTLRTGEPLCVSVS
jgi:hypothetical protein